MRRGHFGADLSSKFVCRLLGYMDEHGYRQVRPKADDEALRPPLPLLSFNSGYVLRAGRPVSKAEQERTMEASTQLPGGSAQSPVALDQRRHLGVYRGGQVEITPVFRRGSREYFCRVMHHAHLLSTMT